jgi:hypothetical protein
MEQGKLDQAESIYRALLAERPDDPRLTRGLAEVQRRQQGPETLPGEGDHVTLAARGEGLRCSWQVTEQGQARARLVLAAPGRLALRLVSFPITAGSSPVDTHLSQTAGELIVTPPAGDLIGAAVGLLSDAGDFVSITHCRPLRLRS